MRGMRLAVALALLPLALAAQDPGERDRKEAIRHYRTGQGHLTTEDWDLAAQEFREAVRLDPLLAAAHYGLGQVHMATKSYPEAIRAYQACKQALLDEHRERLMNSAVAEKRLDDQIRALEDNIRALATGRVSVGQGGQLTAGTIAKYENQLAEMKRRRQRGTEEAPRTPPGLSLALGSAYLRANRLPDAEREYQAALEVEPGLGEAHNNLAVVYLLTGRAEQAAQELAAAEKAGFKVNPGLKADVERARAAKP